MLQCVAVCYSVLQCVAVDACLQLAQVLHLLPLLQCAAAATPVAVSCSVLQCAAVCCSVLQCVASYCSVLQCVAVCDSVLQCVAVAAVCCSVLQLTSVRASTPSSSAPLTHHSSKISSAVILYINCSREQTFEKSETGRISHNTAHYCSYHIPFLQTSEVTY